MSKRIRAWLFMAFIGLFVIGTTLISLYASGYKINLGWSPKTGRLLIKTGMIIIDSQPSGATVYLNNEPQSIFSLNPWHDQNITTTAKLRNIPPGEYDLRLEKKGYLPWSKKIKVAPNQATTLTDINLFRSDVPQLIAPASDGKLSLSPDRRHLYVASEQKIILLRSGQEKFLPDDTDLTGYWLKNSSRLAIGSSLLSFDGPDNDYRQLVGPETSSIFEETTNRLYYEKEGVVSYLDLTSRAATIVLKEENIIAYHPSGPTIWLLVAENGRAILKKYSLSTKLTKVMYELPSVGQYSFINDQGPLLSLYDSQNKTLYLINDDESADVPVIIKDAYSWQWLDKNTLLYNNAWEIFRFDIPNNNSSLLTRVGEELQQIVWNNDRDYIIMATTDSLQIYDPRLKTTTQLLQTNKISAPVLDADSNVLYFWAKIGQQSGIYKTMLH